MIKPKFLLFCFFGMLLVSSCNKGVFFDEVQSLENNKFTLENQLVYEVNATDTLKQYDFEIIVRNSTEYEYSNLWIYIVSEAPDSVSSKVAQRIDIAHSNGTWIGNKSGSIVTNKVKYQTLTFPIKGVYRFTIALATQQEQINHILDIGLRITESIE